MPPEVDGETNSQQGPVKGLNLEKILETILVIKAAENAQSTRPLASFPTFREA